MRTPADRVASDSATRTPQLKIVQGESGLEVRFLGDRGSEQNQHLPVFLYDDWAYVTLRLPGGIGENADTIDEARRGLLRLQPDSTIADCQEEIAEAGCDFAGKHYSNSVVGVDRRLLLGIRVQLEPTTADRPLLPTTHGDY